MVHDVALEELNRASLWSFSGHTHGDLQLNLNHHMNKSRFLSGVKRESSCSRNLSLDNSLQLNEITNPPEHSAALR